MKAFPSNKRAQSVAQGAGQGVWTYWKTDAADVLDAFVSADEQLVSSVVAKPSATLQACQQACTEERLCAGIVFGRAAGGDSPGAGDPITLSAIGASNVFDQWQYPGTYGANCYLLNGVVDPASPRRTLVRALASSFEHLFCPPGSYRKSGGTCEGCAGSGFSTDSNAKECSPLSSCPAPWSASSKGAGCGCPAGEAMKADDSGCVPCSDNTW